MYSAIKIVKYAYLGLMLCALVICTLSCRKLVEEDYQYFESLPTLNAYLISDSVVKVNVSETGIVAGEQIQVVDNAIVDIYVDSLHIPLVHDKNGVYFTTYRCKSDVNYRCVVDCDGKIMSSSFVMPKTPVINNVDLLPNGWVNEEGLPSPVFEVEIENSLDEILYFEVFLYCFISNYSVYDSIADSVFYINRLNECTSELLFTNIGESESSFTKCIYHAHNSWGSYDEYSYVLEIRSLCKDAYDYLKSIENYKQSRYPDFGTAQSIPVNVHSNVANGRGIFVGHVAVQSDTLYENK